MPSSGLTVMPSVRKQAPSNTRSSLAPAGTTLGSPVGSGNARSDMVFSRFTEKRTRVIHTGFVDGSRETRTVATQLSSNVLAGASFQMVALLRHPDGVEAPAAGEIEQISIGAVAPVGVGRPVFGGVGRPVVGPRAHAGRDNG